jgi:ubiquinone biosynthesis protein
VNNQTSPLLDSLGLLKDIGRLRSISQIMVRYGFADLLQRSGVAAQLNKAGESLNWQESGANEQLSAPQRVRLAIQELGPTFIKLGQILATRVDLFDPEWISEFERLQDQVDPLDFTLLRPQLEEDLGASPESLFAWFDTMPLATASIGQVHRARLEDGREVILKIRRPNIRPQIEADLRLLERLAQLAESRIAWLARFRPTELVGQFSRSLRQELDLAAECRNAERIAENFSGDPHFRVPAVYWEWTSERLNVQEFVAGIPARNIPAIQEAGLDSCLIASRGTQAILKMILEDGFFHADPHAGNLFVMPGNNFVMIDWGMIGRLSEARRQQVIKLFLGLVERNASRTTSVLIEWAGETPVDEVALGEEVEAFIDRYHGVPLKQLNLIGLLGDVTRILRSHQLALPSDLALVIKAITTLEGLGRQLNPDFQIVEEAEPVLRCLFMNQFGPQALMRRGLTLLTDNAEILSSLPRELHGLAQTARRGQLRVDMQVRQLEPLSRNLSSAANRLTLGLITSAFIVGAALLGASQPQTAQQIWLGKLALGGAGLSSLWLVLALWNSRKE